MNDTELKAAGLAQNIKFGNRRDSATELLALPHEEGLRVALLLGDLLGTWHAGALGEMVEHVAEHGGE